MSTSVHSISSTIGAAHGLASIPVAGLREVDGDGLHIGLVNNMPDAAMEATERQFRTLLGMAAQETGGLAVRLSLFALPEVPRSLEGRRRIASFYSDVSELWNHRLDGLIVTGAEPVAANLMDEPYWASFAQLTEWAECNTHSAIWSCLAAHAAVLKLDGIARRPLGRKLSGVFTCSPVADHPLTAELPCAAQTPHSRWNDLPEGALSASGYRILTRSAETGADSFVKQRNSLFMFLQGHPEYDADSLLLEYRRDIRRFLRGERNSYPGMPQGCFDETSAALLAELQERAETNPSEALIRDFPAALLVAKAENTWRPTAVNLYRNWLLRLSAHKEQRVRRRA